MPPTLVSQIRLISRDVIYPGLGGSACYACRGPEFWVSTFDSQASQRPKLQNPLEIHNGVMWSPTQRDNDKRSCLHVNMCVLVIMRTSSGPSGPRFVPLLIPELRTGSGPSGPCYFTLLILARGRLLLPPPSAGIAEFHVTASGSHVGMLIFQARERHSCVAAAEACNSRHDAND